MAIKIKSKPFIKQTSNFKLALVDGDLIAFAVASAADGHVYRVIDPVSHMLLFEHRYKADVKEFYKANPDVPAEWLTDDYEPEEIKTVIHSAKQMISAILTDIGAKDYQIYLSGGDNFRFKINPQYKANRIGVRRPYHLENVREYLITNWGAVVTDGIEADDAIGTAQDKRSPESVKNTVAASIDKDFFCFPGHHYQWPHHGKEARLLYVSPTEARINFYKQVLTGDKTDNIMGLHGVGPAIAGTIVKASKSTSNEDLYRTVHRAYELHKNLVRAGFKSSVKYTNKRVLKVARQIWILQERDKMWEPPYES